ncbi:hypothetical protein GDO78_019139 [Eleutherodactylus coqui]|uniref:Uncharacterized protein n=1 Tax=Eleutherodactylus coqui TaxID=57060 RepID=A0A8J6BJU4_ELECQ|nr:hypothetical protein GDO78_019139 [Eleutherodactylus coqui]
MEFKYEKRKILCTTLSATWPHLFLFALAPLVFKGPLPFSVPMVLNCLLGPKSYWKDKCERNTFRRAGIDG